MIITKTLQKKPNAHLHMHLIDILHASYNNFQNFYGKSHEIFSNNTPQFEDFNKYVKTDYPYSAKHREQIIFWATRLLELKQEDPTRYSDYEQFTQKSLYNLENAILAYMINQRYKIGKQASNLMLQYIVIELRSQQFIGWLRNNFPQATLSLSLHMSKDDYVSYITKNNLPNADVLCVADILDCPSKKNWSYHHYICLCKELIQRNSSLLNTWLDMTLEGGCYKPALFTIFLEQPAHDKNAYLMPFKNNNEESSVYMTTEFL
jgi:hypothetical protein